MLEALRRAVPVPGISVEVMAASVSLGAFLWLLAEGYIQPLAVYALELYLSF